MCPLLCSAAGQLLSSLSHLVASFLYSGADSRDAAFALFPPDFHANLRSLLTKLMLQRQADWRECIMHDSIGPPKLVEFGQTTKQQAADNRMAPSKHSKSWHALTRTLSPLAIRRSLVAISTAADAAASSYCRLAC